MAQQAEGWPLGLQPLNSRIGMARNRNNSGSMSFNTLLSDSPSSSIDSSPKFDSENTETNEPVPVSVANAERGVSRILELSRRSIRIRTKTEVLKSKKGKKSNSRSWLFCLCLRGSNLDVDAENNPPSLGQFLALERRATNNEHRKNQSPLICDPDDEFALAQSITEPNTLFVNGNIAPPQSLTSMQSVGTGREKKTLGHGNKWFGSLLQGCFQECVNKLPVAN